MGGGLREYCPKCNKKLNEAGDRVCIKCGWNYEVDYCGQMKLNGEMKGELRYRGKF